jgi:hypothetical protein
MKANKDKHTKSWFINRVGKYIRKNCNADLFNPIILIASEAHARALFLTQAEKNATYNEVSI